MENICLNFLGVGLAPEAAARGYAISEIQRGTRKQPETDFVDRDVVIVCGAAVHRTADRFGWASVASNPDTVDVRIKDARTSGSCFSNL